MTVRFCEKQDMNYPYYCTPAWKVVGKYSVTEDTEDECYRKIWSEHERRMRYLNDMIVEVEEKYADGYRNWCAHMSIMDYYGSAIVD